MDALGGFLAERAGRFCSRGASRHGEQFELVVHVHAHYFKRGRIWEQQYVDQEQDSFYHILGKEVYSLALPAAMKSA